MKELSLDEVLKLQVDILRRVDEFCREYSIQYTVDGGTGIGTIRHKGYIPWDDDIDIAMTRPNYDKFINTFNGCVKNLRVYAPELNSNYYAPYANVCDTRTILVEGSNGHNGMELGVKIDVFPIDGVAPDLYEYHKIKKNIKRLWNILWVKRIVMSEKWRDSKIKFLGILLCKLFLKFQKYSDLQKKMECLVKRYPYKSSNFVENLTMPWPRDVRCSREAFEEYIDAPFENITVSIIRGYDEYLTKLYGNYMQLPPEEQRVPHHGFKAYWK